jgi:hypothetical protein
MPLSRSRQLMVVAVGLLFVAPLALSTAASDAAPEPAVQVRQAAEPVAADPVAAPAETTTAEPVERNQAVVQRGRSQLPRGGRRLFPRYRLVAYYGTAGTGSLGVLGERPPGPTTKRLRAVARRYRGGRPQIQITYELISSIADRSPGSDGDYSHFIDRSDVRTYVRAARRHKAYLVLDLQPGRSTFLSNAKHFRWALTKPWVGLALDPEWRMGPGEVPGEQIGSVSAKEVNRVSSWLSKLTRRHDLPQKLLMLHQFRLTMIEGRDRLDTSRSELAVVLHADGFGTPDRKFETWNVLHHGEPTGVWWGWKNFVDEDKPTLTPEQTVQIGPTTPVVITYQ